MIRIKKSVDPVWSAFFDELSKEAETSEADALEAARVLSMSPAARYKRLGASGAVVSVAYPSVSLVGELAAAAASPKGSRVKVMKAAIDKIVARPELTKQITRGVLGGSVIQGLREGVQLSQAKKTYKNFIQERENR